MIFFFKPAFYKLFVILKRNLLKIFSQLLKKKFDDFLEILRKTALNFFVLMSCIRVFYRTGYVSKSMGLFLYCRKLNIVYTLKFLK